MVDWRQNDQAALSPYSQPQADRPQYMFTQQLARQATVREFALGPKMHPPHDVRHRARTKIVATIGPASSSPAMLRKLLQAGVDVFRLNMAHAGPDEQQQRVNDI